MPTAMTDGPKCSPDPTCGNPPPPSTSPGGSGSGSKGTAHTGGNPYALASALKRVYKKTYNSMGYTTGPGTTAHGAPLQCATQAAALALGCSPGEQAELGVFASDVCQTRGFTCTGLGLGAPFGFAAAAAGPGMMLAHGDSGISGPGSADAAPSEDPTGDIPPVIYRGVSCKSLLTSG